MRYLVALGEEDEVTRSRAVLDAALRHAVPGRDCLLLIRVVEEVQPDPTIVLLNILYDDEEQMRIEQEARKKLEVYDKDCKDAGVDCAFLVISDGHAGSAICKAARDHKAECIVLGRRDMGVIKRMISSSTSRYCVEHSDCNVIVVKRPYSTEDAAHTHKMHPHAQSMSKEEREAAEEHRVLANRIYTLRHPDEMERVLTHIHPEQPQTHPEQPQTHPEQPQTQDPAEQERRAELESVRRLEETERARRLHDLESERNEERAASYRDLTLAHSLEEQERMERVQAWEREKKIERMVRQEESLHDLKLVKKMEEEERELRVHRLEGKKKDLTHHRAKHLERVNQMEEEERKYRIRKAEDDQKKALEEMHEESIKDRKLVAQLEEEERERRIKEWKADDEKERTQRTLERAISLEKLHLAEEQERMYRMRVKHEEDVRERVVARVRSQELRDISKRLEDDERDRRVREIEEERKKRAQESRDALAKVKTLEEEERARRMHHSMNLQE